MEVIEGTVSHVSDHGSSGFVGITQTITIEHLIPVYFDHFPYRWLVESEGKLDGRLVEYYTEEQTMKVVN